MKKEHIRLSIKKVVDKQINNKEKYISDHHQLFLDFKRVFKVSDHSELSDLKDCHNECPSYY